MDGSTAAKATNANPGGATLDQTIEAIADALCRRDAAHAAQTSAWRAARAARVATLVSTQSRFMTWAATVLGPLVHRADARLRRASSAELISNLPRRKKDAGLLAKWADQFASVLLPSPAWTFVASRNSQPQSDVHDYYCSNQH